MNLETQFILNKAITKNTIWIVSRTYITKYIDFWIKLIHLVTGLREPLAPMYARLKSSNMLFAKKVANA